MLKLNERIFTYKRCQYLIIGDNKVHFLTIVEKVFHLVVPSVIIRDNGSEFKVVGIEGYNDFPTKRATIISFEEPSEITKVPIYFINLCKSVLFLPRNVKRIIEISSLEKVPTYIIGDKKNQFVSITNKNIIMNHFPLELINHKSMQSRVKIRETTRIVGSFAQYLHMRFHLIVFPPSVKIIGRSAFFRRENLKSVIFRGNSELERIKFCAFYETSLTKISFPSSLTKIGKQAFYGCHKLVSISFQKDSKLKKIGARAFAFTKLETVDFPFEIQEIGDEAFSFCLDLTKVSFLKELNNVVIGINAFNRCPCYILIKC